MTLEQVVRPYIPVNSFTREPAEPTAQPFQPVVGTRWGKPSRFVHSNQGKEAANSQPRINPPDLPGDPPEAVEIIDFEGSSQLYEIDFDINTDGVTRMTEWLEFTGTTYVDRPPDPFGNPLPPAKQKVTYHFILKLNE